MSASRNANTDTASTLATDMIHGGAERSQHGETCEALYLTQGFTYSSAQEAEARFKGENDGFVYSRYANPTVRMFEERMCLLEGAECARATATGMAAVSSAILCQLKAGDHVVAARALFGSCRWVIETLLPRFGIHSTLVDGKDIKAWEAAVRPDTKLFFFESPTNPTLELVDIKAVCDLAKSGGQRVVVDNVFATPVLQSPLQLGADVVVYSATKHIDGQGRCLGGVVLGSKAFIEDEFQDYYRHTGPSLSPFNAWTMLKGLETLSLRVERQTSNATRIAEFLAGQNGIKKVLYPSRDDHPQAQLAKRQMRDGSTLVAFEIEGGKEAAFRFENALETILISNNLGDAKSMITHPATTTHKNLPQQDRDQLGIGDGLLRLSLGLEGIEDLVDDIERGIAAIA